MNTIVIALITLGAIGLLAAIILYFVSQKFKIDEDPRIAAIDETLPGANCGGCGFPGCHGFAIACVNSENLEGLVCPVGGNECMQKIGTILGVEVAKVEPMVATLLCNGSCANRKLTTTYDGSPSCRIVHDLYTGETECSYGCLEHGDCEAVCQFDAIHINPETKLPEIDEDKCTACYACVKACPKHILEMRPKGPKNRRIWVACTNKDKGGIARKACSAACIGCMKCVKECKFGAITVKDNCAYIDYNKCKLCRKCVAVCPTGAIHEVNFPPRAVANPTANKQAAATVVSNIKSEDKKPIELKVEKPLAAEKPEIKPTVIEEAITPNTKVEDTATKPIVTEEIPKPTATKKPIIEEEVKTDDPKIVEAKAEEPKIEEPTEGSEEKAKNIDDIVNSILKASNSTVQEDGNIVMAEDGANNEPEIDIEALLKRKAEKTEIDDIFKTPTKLGATNKSTPTQHEEDKNKPQQLELL